VEQHELLALAVHNVDSDVRHGERQILLGQNGAGKLTLMKIIRGAYVKDCGSI
jgi:ABC-type sugar transport system ATPase subunit